MLHPIIIPAAHFFTRSSWPSIIASVCRNHPKSVLISVLIKWPPAVCFLPKIPPGCVCVCVYDNYLINTLPISTPIDCSGGFASFVCVSVDVCVFRPRKPLCLEYAISLCRFLYILYCVMHLGFHPQLSVTTHKVQRKHTHISYTLHIHLQSSYTFSIVSYMHCTRQRTFFAPRCAIYNLNRHIPYIMRRRRRRCARIYGVLSTHSPPI